MSANDFSLSDCVNWNTNPQGDCGGRVEKVNGVVICETCRNLKCLDRAMESTACEGPVEYRFPLSGTGKSFPRCDKHWEQRLDTQAELDERYPDSPFPPADFDPTYAGESWDGE